MARVLANVGGVALKPGVSRNRRWYTQEMIAGAVADAQARIARGESLDIIRRDDDDGLSQRTHHAADDDSTRIVGRVTRISLDEDGNARFDAAIADTPHGRTIASLLDTSDGQAPFLRGVSIRGYWKGTVRKVKGPDGQPAEQGSGLSLEGLDYTRTPGVPGAQVDTFAWAGQPGQHETTERVAITESVQEASVTITEETEPEAAPRVPAVAEGLADLLPVPHILNDGACLTCEASPPMSQRGSGTQGAGRVWADPGYQKDKKQRYDISTKANAKAAWAYINQPENAKPYTPAQLKRIKAKIKAALGKFGVQVASETAEWVHGWTYDTPVQASESLAEHYGDPAACGSWSVNASNGPVNICLSSYSMDPEDLDVILRAAADAACKALAALDPDMDGDVDVPGAGDNSDPDGDAGTESAPGGEQEASQAADPAAATTEKEDSMTETTSPAAETAPGIDPKALAEAFAAVLDARDAAKAAAKQDKEAKRARKAATESAAQPPAGTPGGTPAAETEDQRRARLKALVDEQFAAAASREGLVTEKTDAQLVAEMLEERMVPLRQARAEAGGVQRKGIAQLEAIADAPGLGKKLSEATNEELAAMSGAAFGPGVARR